MIQDDIRDNLKVAMKAKRADTVSALRYLLGEFKRLKGTKDGKEVIGDKLTDTQAIRVIKGLLVSENKLRELGGNVDLNFVEVLEQYLPKLASEDEVVAWIKANVDFSALANKMQAVGMAKKHFGDNADGKMISTIVQTM